MSAATSPQQQIYDTIEAGEKIVVADMFCGAGGMSSGAVRVLRRIAADVGKPVEEIAHVIAINHWDRAIETHRTNYPWAVHYHTSVQDLRPSDLYRDDTSPLEEGDPIHLLIACPDCTYFSSARGGGPKDPDSRATPREILDFVERLDVRNLLFENVPEFSEWGPLDDDNRPIEAQKGEYFDHWITALTIEGFNVDWRVLNAADYGDATSRKRLFVAGRKDSGVAWPAQTHSKDGAVTGTEPWRTAGDIIDWSDLGESIWIRDLADGRRSPLANNTMQRIAEGIRRHGADALEPFADALEQFGTEKDRADGAGVTLLDELRDRVVPATDAETVAGAVTDPFLVKYYGTSSTRPVDVPLDTVTSGGQKFALCTPRMHRDRAALASDGGVTAAADPETFVLGQQSGAVARPARAGPLPTIATRGAISTFTADPFVLPKNGLQGDIFSNQSYGGDDRPLHTIVAGRTDQGYVVEPYLVEYYGNGRAQPIDAPVPTIPTKDRFALVVPELYPLGIDVLFRMLKPSELAAAMGFEGYEFAGNKGETVKQIGNAVPVNLAESLCDQLLTGRRPTIGSYTDGVEGGAMSDD